MTSARVGLAGLLAVALVVGAGCGSSSHTGRVSSTPAATSTPTTTNESFTGSSGTTQTSSHVAASTAATSAGGPSHRSTLGGPMRLSGLKGARFLAVVGAICHGTVSQAPRISRLPRTAAALRGYAAAALAATRRLVIVLGRLSVENTHRAVLRPLVAQYEMLLGAYAQTGFGPERNAGMTFLAGFIRAAQERTRAAALAAGLPACAPTPLPAY